MRNPSRSRQIDRRTSSSGAKAKLYDPPPSDDGTDDPLDKPDMVVKVKKNNGDGGKGGGKRVSGAAIKYVRERSVAKGLGTLTRKQAVKKVRKHISADKAGRSYKYDFAGDGAGVKDRDFGTKQNNGARKRMGTRKNITVKANVKGAKEYGTGKVLTKKKATS